jgi:hypothetical protein
MRTSVYGKAVTITRSLSSLSTTDQQARTGFPPLQSVAVDEVRIGREGEWLVLVRDEMFTDEAGRQAVLSLIVELQAEGLSARTSIYLGHEELEPPLDRFFSVLATDWRGWKGSRVWDGIEGGLTLKCRHDGVGTVTIDVELRHLSGQGWTARAEIPHDPGSLDEVAANLRRLLLAE